MERKKYATPVMETMEIDTEGLLCVSDPSSMELPDVTWKDETEW